MYSWHCFTVKLFLKTERLEEKGRLVNYSLTRKRFLDGKASRGNHGQTSVLDLIQLHTFLASGVLRVYVQRVESKV
jgi:hypothetical protein